MNVPTASIAEAHHSCVDAFERLIAATLGHMAGPRILNTHDLDKQAIQNAYDKYKLWAGNVGAMYHGQHWKKSLDYRLREASFYRIQVSQQRAFFVSVES
jgi:hypothetical protein